MQEKIQELTDKLYREGVQKGEEQAAELVAEAQRRSQEIIEQARKEAKSLREEADREAQELKRNVQSEIKLSAQQAVAGLKQQIVSLVTAEALDRGISATLSSPEVIRDLLKTIVENWKAADRGLLSLEVLLPESKRSELEKALKGTLHNLLKDGIRMSFSPGLKGGFQIGPEGSSYKISLTDEDFGEFVKEYLRPRTRAILFGE
jgi:V/A-type H+-transporting ATPase subunit E